jgi:Cu+-exporting ATPase
MSHENRHAPDEHVHGGTAQAATAIDPVCGMDVTPGEAEGGSAEHAGTTYWFCNPSCRDRFVADPAKFLVPPPAGPPAGGQADARIYTCPMHPEIRQVGPGVFAPGGMALEPRSARRRRGPSAELVERPPGGSG